MVLSTMLLAASIASLAITETTGKSVSDHAISAVHGQDCRTVRVIKGEPVCQDAVKSSVVVTGTGEPIVVVKSYGGNSVADMEAIFARRKAASGK